MLEFIWLVIMICVSALCSWLFVRAESMDRDGDNLPAQIQWIGTSIAAMVIGLYLSWGRTGSVFLRWLQTSLPQAGADIATFTAYAIIGICGVVLVAGLPFGFVALAFFFKERNEDQSEEKAPTGKQAANVKQFVKR